MRHRPEADGGFAGSLRVHPGSPCIGANLTDADLADTWLDTVNVLTAAYTGLRAGELAALTAGRLDMLKRSVGVTQTLIPGTLSLGPAKTNAARRTVSLPSFLVDELALHLATYRQETDLVFTAPEGGPIRSTNFRRRAWKPAVEASVGEPMRFHDLRHSHAALLIAAGEHPKFIQSRLGHASIRTTLGTCGHLLDGLDEGAADRLDEAFQASSVDFMWTPGTAEVVTLT